MKRSFIFFLLACGSIMLAGCSEKELGSDDGRNPAWDKGNVVSLSIGSAATKSDASLKVERSIIADLSAESGVKGLVLEESVVNLDEHQAATKGTPVYTQNFDDLYATAGFNAAAVYDSSNQPMAGLAPALFKKAADSDIWSHQYTGESLPASLLFYFNAPATLPAYIGTPEYAPATKSLSFNLVPASYPTVATQQTDVLFTNATIVPAEVNSIKFYHVFASVKFKLGNTDGKTAITKVELSNMLTSGKCTLTVDAAKVSDKNAVWEQSATPSYAKFSQEYDGTIDYEKDGFFDDSFYNKDTYKNNLSKGEDTKATTTFNCVPRSFAEADAKHVVATIYYTVNGESKSTDVDFTNALKGKSWEAGHLYTYTLTVTDLAVTVTDTVTDDIKSDVVITNTGTTSGYIRAAIVADWVKDLGDETVIVKGCDPTSEGTMTNPGTDWIAGTDGYYYYKYGVDAGNATKQALFESYQAAAPTISGTTLQMTIHAQIVKDRSVWGTVPAGLSNDVEK